MVADAISPKPAACVYQVIWVNVAVLKTPLGGGKVGVATGGCGAPSLAVVCPSP